MYTVLLKRRTHVQFVSIWLIGVSSEANTMDSSDILSNTTKKRTNVWFRIVMFIRLLYGYSYKFTNSAVISKLAQCYCIVILFLNFIIHDYRVSNINPPTLYYRVTLIFEATLSIILSIINKEEWVTNFVYKYNQHSYITPCVTFFFLAHHLCFFPLRVEIDLINKIVSYYINTTCLVSRLTLLYIADEYRKCIGLLKRYLSILQTNKHLTDEFKIARIKVFVDAYIELTNDFCLTTKMLRIKVRHN